MIDYGRDKRGITEAVLEVINPGYDPWQLEKAVITWWANIRSTGGLRLTHAGMLAFSAADLECWSIPVLYHHTADHIIKFDHYMDCPFYIASSKLDMSTQKFEGPKIKVYDSRVAMLIQLHGCVHSYLNDKAIGNIGDGSSQRVVE